MNKLIEEALQQISKELASGNVSPEEMEYLEKSLSCLILFIKQNQSQALRVA